MQNKDLILRLIRDDLINYRLVSGLNNLGLTADSYSLYLGETIFSLMGFQQSQYSDMVFERIYMGLAEKVKDIEFCQSRERLDALCLEIYDELTAAKKMEADKSGQ